MREHAGDRTASEINSVHLGVALVNDKRHMTACDNNRIMVLKILYH